MNRGRCNHLLQFQRRAPGKDRAGNPNGAWEKLIDVYAEVQDSIYARSGTMALQEQDHTTLRVLVPWDPTVAAATARDRIRLQDGRLLDIRGGPLGIEGKDMLTFLCEEHAADVVNA